MERPAFQLRIVSLLGVVACIALNLWLFRLGALWGIVGLNVTKHVVTAYLCQVLGVDRHRPQPTGAAAAAIRPATSTLPLP